MLSGSIICLHLISIFEHLGEISDEWSLFAGFSFCVICRLFRSYLLSPSMSFWDCCCSFSTGQILFHLPHCEGSCRQSDNVIQSVLVLISQVLEMTAQVERLKVLRRSSWKAISELRSVTCHMRSHIFTCHPTQVNVPHLNPSQTDQHSIYLPQGDGRLS